MLTNVLDVYQHGDPIHMMEVLTDFLSTDVNLHQRDKNEIAELVHLLAAIARQRDQEQTLLMKTFKIPA